MNAVARAGKPTRIGGMFARLAAEQRTALVSFITAGDPAPEATAPLMRALVDGGSDLIELGMPFSDPMADGPVIQRAGERALAAGMTLAGVLRAVREFREFDGDTPVVVMGYVNPVERYGYRRFAEEAVAAGVDGLLLVDLPADAVAGVGAELAASPLDVIFLLAPTTPPQRMRMIASHARGFLYYVSVKGVTGSLQPALEAVAERIAGLREFTQLPIGVGFGIRSPAQAAQFATVADAVVVGSYLIEGLERAVAESSGVEEWADTLRSLVSGLRAAMDGGAPSSVEARL